MMKNPNGVKIILNGVEFFAKNVTIRGERIESNDGTSQFKRYDRQDVFTIDAPDFAVHKVSMIRGAFGFDAIAEAWQSLQSLTPQICRRDDVDAVKRVGPILSLSGPAFSDDVPGLVKLPIPATTDSEADAMMKFLKGD